jgi:hypothetical protein
MEAQVVYDNYIKTSSPLCVNFSGKIRVKLETLFEQNNQMEMKNVRKSLSGNSGNKLYSSADMNASGQFEEPLLMSSNALFTTSIAFLDPSSRALFDEVQREVFFLMSRDSFMRFIRTSTFLTFWADNVDSYDEFMANYRSRSPSEVSKPDSNSKGTIDLSDSTSAPITSPSRKHLVVSTSAKARTSFARNSNPPSPSRGWNHESSQFPPKESMLSPLPKAAPESPQVSSRLDYAAPRSFSMGFDDVAKPSMEIPPQPPSKRSSLDGDEPPTP